MQAAFHPQAFPVFRILVIYCTGIILGICCPCHLLIYSGFVIVSLLAVLACLIWSKRPLVPRLWFLPALVVYSVFLLLGVWFTLLNDPRTRATYFPGRHFQKLLVVADEPGHIQGELLKFRGRVYAGLCGYPTIPGRYQGAAGSRLLQGQAGVIAASGYLLISLHDTTRPVRSGDAFLIPEVSTPIPGPRNPAAFNFSYFEGVHQVFYQCFLQPGDLHYLGPTGGLRVWAYSLQERACKVISRSLPDRRAAGFLMALIAGMRSALPGNLYAAFSRTGAVHLISISGLHVNMIFALFSSLISRLRKSRYPALRLIRKLLLVTGIWSYALVSGGSPAACRCALAITLLTLTEDQNRKAAGPLMLSLSAFIMLLYQPWLLADMGFQLSYLAISSLYLFQWPVYQLVWFHHALLRRLWNGCATALAAQLLTFPLCCYYFHQFPVYFLVSNLIFIPLTGLLLYLGIVLLLVSPVHVLSLGTAWIFEQVFRLMNWLLNLLQRLPGAVMEDLFPSGLSVILLTILILLAYTALRTKKRLPVFLTVVISTLLLADHLHTETKQLLQRRILFLNTGADKSICLLSGKTAFLWGTDLPDSLTYERILRPELGSRGITSVTWPLPASSSKSLNVSDKLQWFYGAQIILIPADLSAVRSGGRPAFRLVYTSSANDTALSAIRILQPDLVIAAPALAGAALYKISASCRKSGVPLFSIHTSGACEISF